MFLQMHVDVIVLFMFQLSEYKMTDRLLQYLAVLNPR